MSDGFGVVVVLMLVSALCGIVNAVLVICGIPSVIFSWVTVIFSALAVLIVFSF